jgi:hypothetical protein
MRWPESGSLLEVRRPGFWINSTLVTATTMWSGHVFLLRHHGKEEREYISAAHPSEEHGSLLLEKATVVVLGGLNTDGSEHNAARSAEGRGCV